MSAHDALLLIHLILFAYWLGGDLGVFYSSGFVVNPELSRETRLTAAKIMLGCDLVPRICMSLMLTVGGLLSMYIGIEHLNWQLILIILLGPLWLSMVLVLHFKHDAPFIPALTKFDFVFRWFLIAAIIASCLYAYSTDRLIETPWIIGKLLVFAGCVFAGLMIRMKIKDFINTYIKIINDDYSDADNQAMIKSLSAVRPWVVAIWVMLVIEAYLGVAQPGSIISL